MTEIDMDARTWVVGDSVLVNGGFGRVEGIVKIDRPWRCGAYLPLQSYDRPRSLGVAVEAFGGVGGHEDTGGWSESFDGERASLRKRRNSDQHYGVVRRSGTSSVLRPRRSEDFHAIRHQRQGLRQPRHQ
jgi:hypothetical protein